MKEVHTFDIDTRELWLILDIIHKEIYYTKDKIKQEKLEHIYVKLENHLKCACGYLDEEELPNDW